MKYRLNQPLSVSSSLKLSFSRAVFGLAATTFMILVSLPYAFTVNADPSASTVSASTCTPVTAAPSGIISPTGADASTYTFNSCTGLYQNKYYTWSPATQTATPITPYVYTCNTADWQWTYQQWQYDPANDSWQQVTLSTYNLPSGALIAPNSLTICAPPPVVSNTLSGTTSNGSNINSSASNPTGPNTTNSGTTNASTSTNLGTSTTATIDNTLDSEAQSGGADVLSNTTGGSASTGNAAVVSNVLNSVQSTTSLNSPVTTFEANIDGNVQGNLIVDPSQLQPTLNNQTLSNSNLTINSQNSGQISNNLNLVANSGDATVSNNTSAGNATTGNASAVADVINQLNSIVSSGKSFIGVININGNLNGNILVPQSFLNSLIASNAPSTTVSIPDSVASNLGITTNNNQAITNNVTNTATTGSATVSNNTSAGSANSGQASTKVTIFNLTGDQVVGANCLLVFVNVSGTWVGVIMNTPLGTTAAALGGNITRNLDNNTNVNSTNNDAITNNINLAANSGNADVSGNTSAGNATSGNADTVVNLLNLDNTQFSLSGWFGVLFINVFGNWFGNFGVYTPPVAPVTSNSSSSPSGTSQPAGQPPKVFNYVASPSNTTQSPTTSLANSQLTSQVGQVLAASTTHDANSLTIPTKDPVKSSSFQLIGGVMAGVGLLILGIERFYSLRHAKS